MTKKKELEVEVIPTETVTEPVEIVNTPLYDINQLATHLCCAGQFGNILEWLPKLSEKEVRTLRDQLRNRTGMNYMPWLLEHKFRRRLGEE